MIGLQQMELLGRPCKHTTFDKNLVAHAAFTLTFWAYTIIIMSLSHYSEVTFLCGFLSVFWALFYIQCTLKLEPLNNNSV